VSLSPAGQSPGEPGAVEPQPTPADATPADSGGLAPLPLDTTSPQLTWRAVLTGMVLGGLFAVCNVYVGLKTGTVSSMSLAAALLGYGAWAGLRTASGRRIRSLGMLENNICQTASSAGASAASAGLVAAIPALTLLTGQTLSWGWLSAWVLSVMLVGIVVAVPLRRRMIVKDRLRFPAGVACAEMLRDLHTRGRGMLARGIVLVGSGVAAVVTLLLAEAKVLLPWMPSLKIRGISIGTLSFGLSPSLMLVGIGGLIGLRVCAALLLGAVVAYGLLGPSFPEYGHFQQNGQLSFAGMQSWLIWPGVTLMVVGSLASLCLSWRVVAGMWRRRRPEEVEASVRAEGVRRSWYVLALLVVGGLAVSLQISLFGIVWWLAVLAVLLTFALAAVAARVNGEVGLAMVGAMGKITQLMFGAIAPQSAVPNLMAANVTGGAASQCADLMDDLKCGYLLGASPRRQTLAQICGAVVGAMVGSAAYLVLLPDPKVIFRPEGGWGAPAVKSWKAVAELFLNGFDALPRGAGGAMVLAAVAGVLLPVVQQLLPNRLRALVPSPAALGLGFLLGGAMAMTMFVGGLLAAVAGRLFKGWAARFAMVICVGLVVGESLTGTATALLKALWGISLS
jgi:putative OPT family oligopeptide transporter